MTTTPPETSPAPPEGPRVSRDDIRDLHRLRRTVGSQRYVAGVSGGVARHLDIDPTIVRVLFVVLAFTGTGLLLYAALWLLLPAEDAEQAIINLDQRSLTFAVIGVLALSAVLLVGDSWSGFGFPWPLIVVGIVVAVVLLTRDRRSSPAPAGTPAAYLPHAEGGNATEAPPSAGPVGPTGPTVPTGGVPWTPPARKPRPRDPRKRGPLLFWFTLALIALAVGVLGMLDVSGVEVTASAYPALALGITSLMLLVGAVFGRAGGLILLGLLIVPALAVTTVASNYEGEHLTQAPQSAAAVRDIYEIDAGELVVDLSRVVDPEALDRRVIQVRGGLGRLEVVVPDDVDVEVSARIGGPGNVSVFGRNEDGFDASTFQVRDVRDEVATLQLEINLGVGEIVVTSATNGVTQ